MNVGNLIRTAHAFGASFAFAIRADRRLGLAPSDTSRAPEHLPFYHWSSPADIRLPTGCRLVGVELIDEAIELPSFRHPLQAAYVMGPERGSLSPELLALCDFVVKIPTSFCINVGVAGAIVMYDRLLTHGRFAARPLHFGGAPEALPEHVHGGIFSRVPRE